MGSPRYNTALEWADKIEAALTAAELNKVTVTLDALKIPSGSRHGIVVITPPAIEFPTFDQADIEWEIGIVAGPADNLAAAWQKLDAILDALTAARLPLDRADPGGIPQQNGPTLPAYTVTLTTDTTPI